MPQEQTRRRPASTAPRPKIALIVERAITCAATVSDLLAPDVRAGVADLARAAGRAIEADQGSDYQGACSRGLVDAATAACSHFIESTHARLVADGAPRALPLDESQLARSAASLGLPTDLTALSADRRVAARRLLATFRTAQVRSWILDGGLTETLRTTWVSVEEEGELARPGALDAVVERHTAAGIDAERLVWDVVLAETHNHIGLLYHEADKLAPRYRDTVQSDLIGFGWQGLRAALRGYDPTQAAFSTYACPRINGAIRDGLRAEQPIPKRLTTLVNKTARAEEELTHKLGRAPELRELAERVGASMDKMALLPRLADAASIDEMSRHEDSDRPTAPGWLTDDTADPVEGTFDTLRREAIEQALEQLPELEASAVRLQLLDGLTPSEAAERLGLTTRKLRAHKNRALAKLEDLLADWAPAPDDAELEPAA